MSSANVTPTRRTIVYIDGFNLYFGLRTQGWRKFLWLNLELLGRSILLPEQLFVRVNYFTSEITGPADKLARQRSYLAAVKSLKTVTIHRGRYQSDMVSCIDCGLAMSCPKCKRVWYDNNEKMTDVKIATTMLVDAFQNRFDDAILISGDADQKPTIEEISRLYPSKRVYVCFPPSRKSYDLERAAYGRIDAMEEHYRKSQFAPVVDTAAGRTVTRPDKWS